MSKCITTCPYFPDMSLKDGWIWDEELHVKRRKEPKVFRCGYDNHILDWEVDCPREVHNDKEQIN